MPIKFENPEDDVEDVVAAPPPPVIIEAPKLRPPVVNVNVQPTPVTNEIKVMPAEVVVQIIKEEVKGAAWEELAVTPSYHNDGRIAAIRIKRIK